jgi:hypothetical protein
MIKNTEDANKYYQLVNQYIDEYIDKWKIKPTNLKNYLLGNKSKLVNFLERKGLKEVSNIDRVVKDIVEDRVAMFKDNVMTFENFKIFESDEFKIVELKQCLYKGVDKSTIEHEKVLADYWDVSLSQIDPVSPEKHIFKINDLNVVIFNSGELSIIKENIKEYALNQVFNKNLKLDLGNTSIDLEINIKDFIDSEKFKSKIDEELSDVKIKEIVSSILGCNRGEYNPDEGENFIGVINN